MVFFTAVFIALLADGFLRYVCFRSLARIGGRFEFARLAELVNRVFGTRLAELRDLGTGRLRTAASAPTTVRTRSSSLDRVRA